MHETYLIPGETAIFSEEIKKSRFITYLGHAATINEAKSFISNIKLQHPDARHHCWAFIAGAPNDSQVLGFSDDGEPSGTAGRPILAQLVGSKIGEIVAVVVRYYGGVLLGTGGLVKAYGNGVQQALALLATKQYIQYIEYSLKCDYHQLKLIESLINQFGGKVLTSTYTEKIELNFALPKDQHIVFVEKLKNASKGALLLQSGKP